MAVSEWQDIVETGDGTLSLKHPEHGECFHSFFGAGQEALQLYCEGSGFRDRLACSKQRVISVLDVGLGLGYNALSTIQCWFAAESPPSMDILSLEKEESLIAGLVSGQASWQAGWSESWRRWSSQLEPCPYGRMLDLHHPKGALLRWRVACGEAREGLQYGLGWGLGRWNFIWQDPFSPKKNPGMWETAWFQSVAESSQSDAILVTYSVARCVRDALQEAGWEWEKVPAPGTKRHWLRAHLIPNGISSSP